MDELIMPEAATEELDATTEAANAAKPNAQSVDSAKRRGSTKGAYAPFTRR